MSEYRIIITTESEQLTGIDHHDSFSDALEFIGDVFEDENIGLTEENFTKYFSVGADIIECKMITSATIDPPEEDFFEVDSLAELEILASE